MKNWFDVAKSIGTIAANAAERAGLDMQIFDPDVRLADPRFGDYQINGALPYAKRQKTNPRAIAQSIVDELEKDDALNGVATLAIAGPGFINFSLTPAFLQNWLAQYSSETAFRDSASHLQKNETVVVDFSSPNTAKQMHVGHLRSLIIGESICKLLEFCGAAVIRDNHIGDWGTPYGRLFYAYKRLLDKEALAKDPLGELERLYKEGSRLAADDESVLEEARRELVELQNEDPESIALWEEVNRLSINGLKEIYELFDIRFDHYLGESFYRNQVDQVYQELEDTQIGEESEGAWVVFHPEHPRFKKQPFLYRKSDGASNYATTDLATMLYRTEHFKATSIIIETDARQKDHFEQLELTTKKWFEKTGRTFPKFHHVMHGAINGQDGKILKSREGDPVFLKNLLQESIERSTAIVQEKNREKSESGREALEAEESVCVAQTIGVNAIRYAELSQNRTSDYVFDWDKLLSFEGNTAPYLLYAVARINSIFRSLDASALDGLDSKASAFETPEEIALARKIVGFVNALQQTIDSLRPHFLCSYLYELCSVYSGFYAANKVIVEDSGERARRLLLCDRTRQTLKTGLSLLGIPTLERM